MLLRHFMLDVGPQEANCYLLADLAAKTGILVDAGAFEPAIVALAAEHDLRMAAILLTHLHWDHVDGLPEYLRHWPAARVIASAALATAEVERTAPGEELEIEPFRFRVLRTSGHTPESVSYYCAEHAICFVGDALFAGSIGGTADEEKFREETGCIRDHLFTLPDATELLPGHGPVTTVAIERAANPFLKAGFGRN